MPNPRNPRVVGLFPRPVAPKEAPYTDFCFARGRFGTHNIQPWLSDPTQPKETAWFVPQRSSSLDNWDEYFRDGAETVFVEWDRNLIWVGTHQGTYCMSTPALGKPVLEPRKIEKWTVAHGNLG
ncbi:MAG TPA: hypothetical protein VK886_21735 [Vicinamibacterales bacterium]|nr:hypothetical protein [Vicinamibacterales bacterium]